MRINAREIAHGLRLEGRHLRGQHTRDAYRQELLGTRTWGDLQEALDCGSRGEPGGIAAGDFSLRDLAANTIFSRNGDPVGMSFVAEYFDPRRQTSLQEAMGAVDVSAFAGITGQLLINRVLNAFQAESFVISRLIPTYPTSLNGERIPGISIPADPGENFVENEEMAPLNYVGFSEEYIQTPPTVKRRLGIGVTKEAIFFDRTGLILDRAGYVGTLLGLRKEKNLIGVLIGASNTYQEKRKGDSAVVTLNTYYSGTETGPDGGGVPRWVNHLDNNGLVDWTSINALEVLFDNMLDPNTGEPIILPNRRVIIAPQIQFLPLNQILRGDQVWRATQLGIAPTGTNIGYNTVGPNPLNQLGLEFATSRQLNVQLQNSFSLSQSDAGKYWFYGDPAAFAYMENWPITVTQAPTNSEAEFDQDIVVRFKASERGIAAVMEPRRMIRSRSLTTSGSGSSSGQGF